MKLKKYKNFKITYEDYLNEYYKNIFLEEGLIKSVEYGFFIEKTKNFLDKYEIDFNVELIEKNKIETVQIGIDFLNLKNKITFYKKLLQLTNNLGYTIASYIDITTDSYKNHTNQPSFDNIKKIQAVVLFFNKKFDHELYVKNTTVLYHVTTKDIYDNKISKRGLIPKNQNMVSNDSQRIYLSTSIDDCYFFMHEKRNFLAKKGIIKKDWVILKIDISLIAGQINVYRDPKKTKAYYTYDPITPRIISVYKYIKI